MLRQLPAIPTQARSRIRQIRQTREIKQTKRERSLSGRASHCGMFSQWVRISSRAISDYEQRREPRMKVVAKILLWLAVAVAGAVALATIAFHRGETIGATWLVVAALCSYALGYRFYSKFIAAKVLSLDAT